MTFFDKGAAAPHVAHAAHVGEEIPDEQIARIARAEPSLYIGDIVRATGRVWRKATADERQEIERWRDERRMEAEDAIDLREAQRHGITVEQARVQRFAREDESDIDEAQRHGITVEQARVQRFAREDESIDADDE